MALWLELVVLSLFAYFVGFATGWAIWNDPLESED